jgi:AAA domain
MPLSARELEKDPFLRVLLMGPPKVGKTSLVIATSPSPVRVLLCESDSALTHAVRVAGPNFTFERTKDWNTMSTAIQEARKDAEAGKIKTLIVDPLSDFATVLEEQCLKQTDTGRGPDGRRAYPEYNRRMRHLLEQLFRVPAHLVVVTHYIDTGGGEVQPDGGGEATPRTGEGIVPLLPGKARALVAARFPDVVWMDYQKGERVLVTGPRGAWGPGCRSLGDTQMIPANVNSRDKNIGIIALIKAFAESAKAKPIEERPQRREERSTPTNSRPQQRAR